MTTLFQPLLLVFLGGGVGSVLRYLVTRGCEAVPSLRGSAMMPLATLGVNVVGCLVIGIVAAAVSKGALKEEHRLLLAVGLMGGFTTFSTYALELVQKATDGHWVTAGAYLLLSNVLGVVAVVGGMKMVG
ncbi:MAG: fluoride efflux transporter CrcB [Planctomycetes bacterium]|nr:fluoride efflux transporter CrcB [Planctomycetota bacterium]